MDTADGFSIRPFASEENPRAQWVVSGPTAEAGKRWRMLFEQREEAEEFLREERRKRGFEHSDVLSDDARIAGELLKAKGKTLRDAAEFYLRHLDGAAIPTVNVPVTLVRENATRSDAVQVQPRSSPFIGTRLALMLAVIACAFFADRSVRLWMNRGGSGSLLSADFEASPLLSGWTSSGAGVEWTQAEHFAGTHSVVVRNAALWSPMMTGNPMQWYRLAFHSKAPGVPANVGSAGYGFVSVFFYDEAGNQLPTDFCSSVVQSDQWQANEICFRAQAMNRASGALRPSRMKVSFRPIGEQPFFVDNVTVEETTGREVTRWADALYEKIPAKLQYIPKPNRWQRIPLTMEKLRRGDHLRVVMLGDSIQQDLADSPVDLFIRRSYPGSRIEIFPSTKGGTGAEFFRNNVFEYVTRYKPDLVIIGGISNRDDMTDFQSIVDQVKTSSLTQGIKTEVMILSRPWSPNSVPQNAFFLAPDIRELDQKPENNEAIPDDYRGHLLRFAAANNIEFLDMTGIVSEFIYGPGAAAKVGPPTGANGEPYTFWMRDWVHPNDCGREIMGRILQSYFTPASADGPGNPEAKKPNVTQFDPDHRPSDQHTLLEALKEFEIDRRETPVFAETFSEGSRFLLDRMMVRGGVAVSEPEKHWAQLTRFFDQPLDVREGDVVVYWSFHADTAAGAEWSKLYTYLNFTDPPPTEHPEPARVAINIRPRAFCVLYRDPGWEMTNDPEIHVRPLSASTFRDAQTNEKFRMAVRWAGGDRVLVDVSYWNRAESKWEGLVLDDKPNEGPAVMELSIKTHLLNHTAFKSLMFQSYSDAPKIDTVIVTRRSNAPR